MKWIILFASIFLSSCAGKLYVLKSETVSQNFYTIYDENGPIIIGTKLDYY